MKWGIISTGTIAKKFAKTINQMEGEELIAVGSRNIESANAFKSEFNVERAYGSYQELCMDKDIEVIYIATPNSMHYENALMCLKHGKHVLCEKPFTINDNEASYLYNYAKDNNLFIAEALWTRFLPSYKKIKELLNNNVIGDIKSIEVNYGFDTNPIRKTRKFDSSLGGGALLDIGIYNLGFIEMIMDDTPYSFESKYELNEMGTDSYSEIDIRFINGVEAKSVCAIGREIKREAYIKGSLGYIYLPDFQNAQEFTLNINNEANVYSYPFKINGFEYQIEEVVNSIKNNMNSSAIYKKESSIALMRELTQIRASWNMKFSFEK